MKVCKATLLLVIMATMIAGLSAADVPRVVSYQGRLTVDGAPVEDGPKNVRFIIWDDPTSTLPANEVWSSGPVTVNTVDGLFSVILGDASMAPFPEESPSDTGLWLGITVGADPEMTPRTRLTSSVFALRAGHADTAAYALETPAISFNHGNLTGLSDDDHPQYLLTDGSRALSGNLNAGGLRITNLATATSAADAVRLDQVLADGAPAGGDLTGTYPNPELASNSVGSAQISYGAVYTGEIANGTIVDIDIGSKADIDPTKILGTAVNLTATQTISGEKRFQGDVQIGDSTLRANHDGVRIGDDEEPATGHLLHVERDFNYAYQRIGVYSKVNNLGTGGLAGVYGEAYSPSDSTFRSDYGVYAMCHTNGAYRHGVLGFVQAEDGTSAGGNSYGVYGSAYYGDDAIGVFGSAHYATTNYAGYFSGNINVTGSVIKSGSLTLIDHPDNPSEEYLQYGAVESTELKVVLDGTVITDNDGKAEIVLPDWFEKVTEDHRYQLTVIGSFARAIIAEKISDGRFVIATDESHVEVCWQVTGVRSDPWAKAHAVKSTVAKKESQRGLYRHAELQGQPDELSEDYVHRKDAIEERARHDVDRSGN